MQSSRRGRRAVARVERKLDLASDQSIEVALLAQRWLPFLQVALFLGALGDLVFLIVARPCYVAATQSHLFVLKAGRLYPSVGDKVFDAPLNQVRIERARSGPIRRVVRLTSLGSAEQQLAVHRAYWKDLDALHSLIDAAAAA